MGALRNPLEPIFHQLSPKINLISVGNPGMRTSIEFEDGKRLFGITHPFDQITLKNILPYIHENGEKICRCDVLCSANWTILIHLNAILTFFKGQTREDHRKFCFFDFADPEKSSAADIHSILHLIQLYTPERATILGLN
jgi:hypothetical protein